MEKIAKQNPGLPPGFLLKQAKLKGF